MPQLPTGLTGPEGVQTGQLSVEKAWSNLMTRIGKTSPARVQRGSHYLDAVDKITGMNSKAKG